MSKSEGPLLDSSVLIPLCTRTHIHHDMVMGWLSLQGFRFATCPITQGALLRVFLQFGTGDFRAGKDLIGHLMEAPGHEFIADDIDFRAVPDRGIVGHRQVTDAYLAQLARKHGIRLATLDEAQAALNPDVAVLVA